MCYEFSEWTWKARAAELTRKQREAEKAAKNESKPEPVTPAVPEPRAEEHEVPA